MQTVKLSVTVQQQLQRKYAPAALEQINRAVQNWVAADAQRGIRTLHVALDDAAAMRALGATAISGRPTAARIKRAIDKLWKRVDPDYLVLFGGDDIIPMFVVANPSHDFNGDDDEQVPTDNPYASSVPFRSSKRNSYLVPDRVIGRIPDVVSESDPAWLVDYLATVTSWTPQPANVYTGVYAICCDEWNGAGAECVQYIGAPATSLLISPPVSDSSTAGRNRLSSRLHMVKCHGAQLDPTFYGQSGDSFPEALTSATLKTRLRPATLAAAMCCYGAQTYSPADPAAAHPGEWPLASTYLRKGAVGFAGSTMIAWVGGPQMMCADWIVAAYLKGTLGGASTGRAFLESKQDYMRWINQQGRAPDRADEKTLIEYVLLGDPSVHPVSTAPAVPARAARAAMASGAPVLASQERRQRRFVRTQMAGQIRKLLPTRIPASSAAQARAPQVFTAAKATMHKDTVKQFKAFGIKPEQVQVEELCTPLPAPAVPAGGPALARAPGTQDRCSLAYYWSGRREHQGHRQIQLVKVETDPDGHVLRTVVLYSS